MKLNSENDVYQGDLGTLNANKQAWSISEKETSKYRTASWIILAAGFMIILIVMMQTKGGDSSLSQLPMHVSIWVTAIAAILVNRRGKKLSDKPFDGFHMAHFEADDNTLYYQYQKGLSLCTYYIKDNSIKKIYRDDTAGVIVIEGDAVINTQTRKGETEENVSEFYALIPFDKYDLDDLLQPYKRKVKNLDGKLREKYTEEHL